VGLFSKSQNEYEVFKDTSEKWQAVYKRVAKKNGWADLEESNVIITNTEIS
jgi:arylamine N-acetyltransferase